MTTKKRRGPQLKKLSLIGEIALINFRRDELLERLGHLKTAKLLERARKTLDKIEAAQVAGDQKAIDLGMSHLDRIIKLGQSEEKTWKEIYELIDHKAKLVENELSCKRAMQNEQLEKNYA